jgi:hypothetical protein
LIQRPGIETWGCTLGELREYCKLGFEEAPQDIDEEEKQDPKTFKPINEFAASHQAEMKALKSKLHTGIADFAALLSKFDAQNPSFTATEQKIMQKLLYNGDSIQKIFWADGGLSKDDKKKYMKGTEAFRKVNLFPFSFVCRVRNLIAFLQTTQEFLTSGRYSEDIRPAMRNSFKRIIGKDEGARFTRAKVREAKERAAGGN